MWPRVDIDLLNFYFYFYFYFCYGFDLDFSLLKEDKEEKFVGIRSDFDAAILGLIEVFCTAGNTSFNLKLLG